VRVNRSETERRSRISVEMIRDCAGTHVIE
jgi:hypothetical protein